MQDLKDHFSGVGRVRFADVLREAGPGSRSKGCGIVEFESAEEAAEAIQQLNDSELGGRKIWIRWVVGRCPRCGLEPAGGVAGARRCKLPGGAFAAARCCPTASRLCLIPGDP